MLVGLATADDAGVYKISDDLALIQTVDFFTPIVDDPYDFGRIAAANALSDVYAMGGVPKTAMNIVAYPMKTLGDEALREILAGGAAILKEAGTVLLGGHSVEDEELKYGLSVTGFVHPEKILANQGLRAGDCLVLTKPLGTGIVNTAIKGGLASVETIQRVTKLMVTLNRQAAAVMSEFTISACTDITGFGLLGHIAEMIIGTGVGVTIESSKVPVIAEAVEFASMGFVPLGAHNNREFRQDMVVIPQGFDPVLRDILFDPQTSGGLLIGCRKQDVDALLKRLHDSGAEESAFVGYVTEDECNMIQIQ
ncbi:MAG: selenide,water dikinase [Desulforhopalus sp.]